MSAHKLIKAVHQRGGTLELTNGKLIARNIPAAMLKDLREAKPEIMALLAANDEPRPTPGLLEVVKRMANFYQYTDEERTYTLSDARANPDTWRELIRGDRHAAQFVDTPEHQLEVVNMLRADSSLRYAFTTRIEGDDVIVSLAVRDVAVCELTIPASHYDPMTFWKTINEVTS